MTYSTFVPEQPLDVAPESAERRTLSLPAPTLATLIAALDGVLVVATILGAEAINRVFGNGSASWFSRAMVVGLPAATVFVVLSASWGRYSTDYLLRHRRPFISFLQGWLAAFFVLGWFGFLTKTTADYSRFAVTVAFCLGFVTVFGAREAVLGFVRQRVQNARLALQKVFVLHADPRETQEQRHQRLAREGVCVVGQASAETASLRKGDLATWSAAIEQCRAALARQRFDAIYLFLPWRDLRLLDEMHPLFARLPVPVYLFPDQSVRPVIEARRLETASTTAFEVQRPPLSRAERIQKRALDLALGTFLLLLLSPLMAMVALAILLTDGRPVLFRQRRNGFGGRPFAIFKFRTMTVCEDGPDIRQAQRGDSRVTSLGHILRRTSVDELPQLINVLRGEMSLIGPRPHALAHDSYYDQLIASYAERQHVAPGMTGWAQVNGCRGETRRFDDMVRRVDHDLWYINHWSLRLDLRILALTSLKIFDDSQAF
jgi:Undecaprenyl-phosphate glucose phosphotransferase